MRAIALHRDVIVLTSALLHLNCAAVRAPVPATARTGKGPAGEPVAPAESVLVDSPLLPDELELLPSLLEQAGFPPPSGLLVTHGDWDHLLGPSAFPGAPLGCAQSTAERLAAEPGAAQRALRAFDEELYIRRERPLALGVPQPLPVPGRCDLGEGELELHLTGGHTADGMALLVPWAGVLLAGDYLSSIEIPTLGEGGDPGAYLGTLARLRPALDRVQHVVPGHGPVLARDEAQRVLEEDLAYLHVLLEAGAGAALPPRRRSREQRRLHDQNVAALGAASPRS